MGIANIGICIYDADTFSYGGLTECDIYNFFP